jgi:hypothetical protein
VLVCSEHEPAVDSLGGLAFNGAAAGEIHDRFVPALCRLCGEAFFLPAEDVTPGYGGRWVEWYSGELLGWPLG